MANYGVGLCEAPHTVVDMATAKFKTGHEGVEPGQRRQVFRRSARLQGVKDEAAK